MEVDSTPASAASPTKDSPKDAKDAKDPKEGEKKEEKEKEKEKPEPSTHTLPNPARVMKQQVGAPLPLRACASGREG